MPATSASSSTRRGRPAATQQDVRALDDLGGHAVVEVVVHLLGELVVGQRREIDLRVLVLGHPVDSWPGVPRCGTVPYDGTTWTQNLAEPRRRVQSPVHRASLRRARHACRRPDRGDRGRRAGEPAKVHGRAPARVARARGRRSSRSRATRAIGWAVGWRRSRRASCRRAPWRGSPARRSPSCPRRVGEAAGLSVPDGDLVHYVEQVDTPEPGLGPRLDRLADPDARGFVRAGAARVPAAVGAGALPRAPLERFTDLTLVDPAALRERLREVLRRRLRVGARGVRSRDQLGRRADRRRIGRGGRGGPPPRPVVSVPGSRRRGRVAERVVATAAQIASSLRQSR